MGDRRTRNSNAWANYVSVFPIWGKHIGAAIRSGALAKNQKEAADAINPVDEVYQESPYAKQQLATAQQMLNGRMPGASQLQQGALNNQSNSFMNLSRAAGSPQQMIAAAGALQGNTNSALNNLAVEEAQYKQGMLGNFNQALGTMIGEGNKVYDDRTNRFYRQYSEKQGLLNSSTQNQANVSSNIGNATGAIVNTAMQLVGMGNGGGMFSGGSKGGNISSATGGYAIGSGNNYANPGSFNPFATSNGIAGYR